MPDCGFLGNRAMTLRKRIAVTLPAGSRVADTMARVCWAEQHGYNDAWFADAGAPDALTTAAALAGITRHIRIGVAVTPVFTRTPAVLAATANTLGQLLPGRFVLGLGTSSQTMMIDWHGVTFDKPLTRVRNTALLVRSMLQGEKSDFDQDGLRSRNYRQEALENPPPIYLAALRPKMIETAAEVGDGVIINLWPRSTLPKILEHVRIGAERAGKDWRGVEIVNRAMVLVTDDKPAARDLFRAAFAPYYANPVYNHFLAWAGFAGAAGEIATGWAARDRIRTAAALSDALVDEIAVIGSADECRARITADAAAGIHTQIIAPLAGAAPAAVEATLAAFAADRFRF
jgi:probable F420-dependent oxidoreductase